MRISNRSKAGNEWYNDISGSVRPKKIIITVLAATQFRKQLLRNFIYMEQRSNSFTRVAERLSDWKTYFSLV